MDLHFKKTDLFDSISEEEVISMAARGDDMAQEYLIKKYKRYVAIKAKGYYMAGSDRDDVIQEGMIGLFKAIRDYDGSMDVSFRTFADICIQRQMISAVKAASRKKHEPLNTYVSFDKQVTEDENPVLMDMIVDDGAVDPEKIYIIKEELCVVNNAMNDVLSNFELEVLKSYLEGKSYQEIARDMNRQEKSIDNALQRVKRKLEKTLCVPDGLSTA